MSPLARLFKEYNKQVYGKYSVIPKKAEASFHKIEMMLTKSDISLEDYCITTFTDRIHLGQQLGYLPWQAFTSIKSLERYVNRLNAGAEVCVNKIEPKTWLNMEISAGEVIIALILNGIEPDHDTIEHLAGIQHGWMNDTRRPIQEAVRLLQRKYQSNQDTYEGIARQIRSQREELESRIQAKDNSFNPRKRLVDQLR